MKLLSDDYVFPLIGGTPIQEKDAHEGVGLRQIYGTAFHIGKGFFLTAGHSVENALSHEYLGLAVINEEGSWSVAQVSNQEVIHSHDLGIVSAEIPEPESFQWDPSRRSMLQDVTTMGFPYGYDPEHSQINVRSFKGYIVSGMTLHELKSNPLVYELSFQCPRGLSGAPLLSPDPRPKILGLIIMNHATEMLVSMDKERISEDTETIVERYESLQLGIALRSRALTDVSSEILGNTIGSHLMDVGLLDDKT